MTLFPKSIICSVCIILLVNQQIIFPHIWIIFFLFQNGSSEARTPEERLKLLAKSEFDTVIAVLNEYFLDSKINHDKLINDTENFIVQYRSHFLKDFNFGSAKVTDCLRKYLQTDCPIEARECAQDEEYDNLKRQIFQTVIIKRIRISSIVCVLDFRKTYRRERQEKLQRSGQCKTSNDCGVCRDS